MLIGVDIIHILVVLVSPNLPILSCGGSFVSLIRAYVHLTICLRNMEIYFLLV